MYVVGVNLQISRLLAQRRLATLKLVLAAFPPFPNIAYHSPLRSCHAQTAFETSLLSELVNMRRFWLCVVLLSVAVTQGEALAAAYLQVASLVQLSRRFWKQTRSGTQRWTPASWNSAQRI